MNPKRMLIILAVVMLSLAFVMAALAAADYSQQSSSLEPPINSIKSRLATQSVFIDVNYAHDWVEGWTGPDEPFTVTLSSDGDLFTVTGQADGSGWFGTHQWPWTPYPPNFMPGNVVQVSAAGGTAEVNPIGTIHGDLDFAADTVSGSVEAPWFSPTTLDVHCQVWVENGPPEIVVTGVDPDGGNYSCDFTTVGWDLQPGQTVAVRYYEPDGDSVINIFEAPWMRVNYAHDWVGGNYELGHTFWITVTDSGGAVKATAELDTWSGGGWGGDGFETQWFNWIPSQPDIQSYDWVYFLADDGYANAVQVGDIDGAVDVDNDSVGGPIYADWFTQTLPVECHSWSAPAPGKNSSAEPDGSVPFFCQWDALTEWDVQPGQDIAVMYIEPDFDRVINVIHDPAPNVRVEKWPEGSNQAMPGGPVVYTIRYTNDGDATATTIYLTDTLPVSTTYLTDSGGGTPAFGPGWVAWTLGPLDPGEWLQFQLVLNHTANPGDTLHNVVDSSTLYDFDFGNNHAEADVTIADELPDLYVNKHPEPRDPMPGQTMLWEVYYGNNGPVASGPVTLTDTLPLGTTVVEWYSENGYTLWTDVSVSGDQLVLEAPTIPGYWSDVILLRIQLDPALTVGTQLTNLVEIATAGDTNPDDNWHLRDDVWVGSPRWNGFVDKNFNWGTIVPGGQVDYNLHARNLGNMAAHFWLTDTLPADTTIAYAWLNIGPNSYPFPPDAVDGNIAVWDLGILEPGEWRNINLHLTMEMDAVPGTALTNCAEIGHAFTDDSPQDNVSCTSNILGEFGTNLEIIKTSWWNWEGQIHYEIRLANIGTTTEYSVTITDTLPAGTVFNGSWWHNWSPDEVQFTEQNGQLVWTLDRIEPTWNWYVSFDLDLEGNLVGDPGLAYTNTADVPLPGDVSPADNHATAISTTGPDIYVDKWLSGGIPRPGEIVTFTIEFGNQNLWPWDAAGPALLRDTLPPEMTFIKATDPRDPKKTWSPTILPGNVLVWGWGDLCPDCRWRFDLVVQITGTDTTWDVLPNTVEMYSLNSSGHDLEWDYGNNTATIYVTNALYKLYLPIIKNE